MNRKKLVWLKPIIFLVGLALLFSLIQPLFTVTEDKIYQAVKGFYEEEPETLDAIYVGASNVYASWQGPVAWNEFGIACYGLSIPSMPAVATKYMIEECRKTQPDALFILNLNNFKSNGIAVTESDVHYMANFMPFSKTKVKMINELSAELGFTGLDKAEFYLPIIRFHSGWNEFTTATFNKELKGLKGASFYEYFLTRAKNISAEFRYTEKRSPITGGQEQTLQELVAYCKNENVNTLFIFSPQAIDDETAISQINSMKDYVTEEGFPVLDLMENIDELKLDLTSDFHDPRHGNIHGAIKFTRYLGAYLKENYGFRDKRGEPAYASWDKAAKDYTKIIEPHTLDFERENAPRNNGLIAPKLTKATAYGESIRIDWAKTPGATGYAVYRQYTDPATKKLTPWAFVAEVDADTLTYTDKRLQRYVSYKYTVVPTETIGGETVYGNFSITGLSAETTLPAPELLDLEETDAGVTISWKPLEGAEGYIVYRKIVGQSWVNQGTLSPDATTYTDTLCQPDVPYIYMVRAFQTINGENVRSDYDRTGLLRFVELPKPEPAVQLTQNGPEITWAAIKGATSYSVYVQDADKQLHAIALHTTATSCLDKNYVEGTSAAYTVIAEIKHGSEYYEFPSDQIALTKGDN